MKVWYRGGAALAVCVALAFIAGGCTKTDPTTKSDDKKPVADAGKGKPEQPKDDKKADSKHAGWWCDEHGIPEEECSMCSSKIAAEFKKKGDWCDKHDRAKSQCFICDPKLKEKYAARYRAKLGKEPPPIEEEEEVKKAAKEQAEKEKKKDKE